MSSETIDLTKEIFLPEEIKNGWIPIDGLSVPHLFQFTQYPPQETLYYKYPDLNQLLHEEETTNLDPQTLVHTSPPPQKLIDIYKDVINKSSSSIHSFTLVPLSGDPVRLPTWVLDYWTEISCAVGYRRDWKKVLVWLRGISQSESMVEICDQVMAGLSYFPWHGGKCTVHDMASILSGSWLSDFHIDHTLKEISKRHCEYYGTEASGRHKFLTVSDIDGILKAYKSGLRSGETAKKTENFKKFVENEIISGRIDSVAGAIHLPNHWTSLVVTFNPPKIFYGDSLGGHMPSNKASPIRRWVYHMVCRSVQGISMSDISIYPLATSMQPDYDSCGLFALNAIEHHYLQQNTPLLRSDTLSLARYRMEIALGLLQDDAVSIFPQKLSLMSNH